MRVTKYDLRLDADRKPMLVKETARNFTEESSLDSPEKIARLMELMFDAPYLPEEHLWAIALDVKRKPIGVFEVSHGIVDGSYARPREIFVRLCVIGAVDFVLVHNHPSGDTTPSSTDIESTKNIFGIGKVMGINLLDHIIVGDGANYHSMLENGEMS